MPVTDKALKAIPEGHTTRPFLIVKKVKDVSLIVSGMVLSGMMGYMAYMIKDKICCQSIKCIIDDM